MKTAVCVYNQAVLKALKLVLVFFILLRITLLWISVLIFRCIEQRLQGFKKRHLFMLILSVLEFILDLYKPLSISCALSPQKWCHSFQWPSISRPVGVVTIFLPRSFCQSAPYNKYYCMKLIVCQRLLFLYLQLSFWIVNEYTSIRNLYI